MWGAICVVSWVTLLVAACFGFRTIAARHGDARRAAPRAPAPRVPKSNEDAFDLRDLVEETIESVASRAHAKGVSVVGDVDDDVPGSLRGDVAGVRRVLVNLVGNAVELTDRGGVSLHVRMVATGVTAKLRITVSDTSTGFASERARAIVASRTKTDGASGIGLAIAAELVERMGGAMGIASELGSGSTFWAELAFARSSSPSGAVPANGLRGRKILVIDDEWACRRSLRRQLREWGCEVHDATSGLDAIAHLAACGANDPFDVVLVDRVMPEMDGLEAARAIRANPHVGDVPLVLLSPFGVAPPREHTFAAVVTKPVRRAHLSRALAAALGRGAQSFASPRAKMLAT